METRLEIDTLFCFCASSSGGKEESVGSNERPRAKSATTRTLRTEIQLRGTALCTLPRKGSHRSYAGAVANQNTKVDNAGRILLVASQPKVDISQRPSLIRIAEWLVSHSFSITSSPVRCRL